MSAPSSRSEGTGLSRLTLCADDFAWSPATSRVIAALLETAKLNATGCMTLRPNWPEDSRRLRDLPAPAQIGLHLVLTDEQPLASTDVMVDIVTLRGRAAAGRLDRDAVAAEVAAQFDRFEQAMGRPPAFVDGHQHAHSLPTIREVVLDATRRRAPGAWVRTCQDRWTGIARRPFRGKAIGSAFHSRRLRAQAAAEGLACNRGFAGHYDFRSDFAALFPHFLAGGGAEHLVMCHPGADDRAGDVIAAARVAEAAALAAMPVAAVAAARGLDFVSVAGGA